MSLAHKAPEERLGLVNLTPVLSVEVIKALVEETAGTHVAIFDV